MAESTESSIVVDAPPSQVLAVIADLERYPEWTGDIREVTVLETGSDDRPSLVRFSIDAGAIKDTYTLRYDWDLTGDLGTVAWSLVEASVLKAMDGSYTLSAQGEGTQVLYRLTVDLKIPMLGMLKRKAEKLIVDTALKGLKRRVEQGA